MNNPLVYFSFYSHMWYGSYIGYRKSKSLADMIGHGAQHRDSLLCWAHTFPVSASIWNNEIGSSKIEESVAFNWGWGIFVEQKAAIWPDLP